MLTKIKSKLMYRLAIAICDHVSIGGQCRLCDRWVDDCLAPTEYRVVVCKHCSRLKKGE